MGHALVVLAVAALAAADATPRPPELRLPEGVRPVRQAVELTVDPNLETFSGSVEIELEVRESTSLLWLNAIGLKVTSASLGQAGAMRPAKVVAGGDDFVGFSTATPLAPGPARLDVSFEGGVSRRDKEGVFAVKEADAWYLFTQFEALAARRAFPCFDEPGYKIPWQVTLRVPHGLVALSNSPASSTTQDGDRDVVRYSPTPPLPSYLVAFAVGPFDLVDVGPAGRKGTPTRLVVPRGRGSDTAWARESTPRILALLEDYFDRPYPYDKLDQVAIPGVGFAMEHPGLVTYGMGAMVQRPAEETIAAQARLGGRLRPRAGPPVVRRPRHDGLVGRHLAQRVLRELARRQGDGSLPAGVGRGCRSGCEPLERSRPGQPGDGAAHSPADCLEGRHLQRLRRRHLRKGPGRAGDGRSLAGRGRLPPRRAGPHRPPRPGQRDGGRLHRRAFGRGRSRRRPGAWGVPRPDRRPRDLGRRPMRRSASHPGLAAALSAARVPRRAPENLDPARVRTPFRARRAGVHVALGRDGRDSLRG